MTTPANIPRTIEVLPTRGAPGFLTTDNTLVLQRRGITSTLEAGVPLGTVTVDAGADECVVRVSNAAGYEEIRVGSLGRAIGAAAELATRLVGSPVRPAPFTAASTFGCRSPAGSEDRLVSPLRYEPGTDTVRIVTTNVCVAYFEGGGFNGARLYLQDPAGEVAWRYVERALATDLPAEERECGEAHCKRRLAWLAGALWLAGSPSPLTCGVLTGEMEHRP